jgi:hypothetical protein
MHLHHPAAAVAGQLTKVAPTNSEARSPVASTKLRMKSMLARGTGWLGLQSPQQRLPGLLA